MHLFFNRLLGIYLTSIFLLISCSIFAEQLRINLTEGEIRHRQTQLNMTMRYIDDHQLPHRHQLQLGINADYVVEEVDEHGDSILLIVPETLNFRIYEDSYIISEFNSEDIHPISFQNIIAPSLKVKLSSNGKVRELYGMHAFFERFKEELGRDFDIDLETTAFLEELHFMISSALEQNLVIFPEEDVTHKSYSFSPSASWHSSLKMSPIGRLHTHDFPNSQELYTWTIGQTVKNKYEILIDGTVSGSGKFGLLPLKLMGTITGKAEVEMGSGWTTAGHTTWEYRYKDQSNGLEIPPEIFSAEVEVTIQS